MLSRSSFRSVNLMLLVGESNDHSNCYCSWFFQFVSTLSFEISIAFTLNSNFVSLDKLI